MALNSTCAFRVARHGIVAGLALSLALAGCASSSTPNLSTTDTVFVQAVQTWDLDRDGDVTCQEWKTYAQQLFQQADGNGDNVLTRDEFTKLAAVDRLFVTADLAYFDANGDGSITLSELVEKPNPAFKYLDKNHDCRLTQDEMPTIWGNNSTLPRDLQQKQGRSGRGR